MQVQYFSIDGFEGKFFTCERYGTMSPTSCAKNFAVAPDLVRTSGRLDGCLGCKVGQHHADPAAPVRELPGASALTYRQVCVRCRRGSEAVLGRMRLVRDHTICVSCYNREDEVRKGRNAKGAKPKKWARLLLVDVQIGCVSDGRLVIEQFDHPVRDRLEAVLTLMRRKSGPKVVAWSAARIQRAEVVL
jgi:hypothetical protein